MKEALCNTFGPVTDDPAEVRNLIALGAGLGLSLALILGSLGAMLFAPAILHPASALSLTGLGFAGAVTFGNLSA